MNTWIVGNMPVAHQIFRHAKSLASSKFVGEKTFYMKARIIAGQLAIKNNHLGLDDFKWVTKDELQTTLRPRDFAAVKDILAER